MLIVQRNKEYAHAHAMLPLNLQPLSTLNQFPHLTLPPRPRNRKWPVESVFIRVRPRFRLPFFCQAVSLFSASGSDRDHCSLAPGQMLSSGLTDFVGIHGREVLRQGRLLRTVTKFI